MKKGQDAVNVAYLIGLIALFLVIYVILLPEADKDQLVTGPGEPTPRPVGPGQPAQPYPTTGIVLLSETPGKLYPYGRNILMKPLASINLFSGIEKQEELLTPSLTVESSFLRSASKSFTFQVADPRAAEQFRLLFFVHKAQGDIVITLNGKEIFNGKLLTSDLPLELPHNLLRTTNTLTFSTPAEFLRGHEYMLRDVILFREELVTHPREFRDIVLSRDDIQNLEHLTLYYFVNCFTARERGTLTVLLNGNLLSQQLVVCDAGEVSQDLPITHLIPGRNVLEFMIDNGQFVLEQAVIEGNTGQGRVPSYFFTLQTDDVYRRMPVGMDVKFYETITHRKVGTIFINGFPLYIDTHSNAAFFDITSYVTAGQNIVKIIPESDMNIVDLTVYAG